MAVEILRSDFQNFPYMEFFEFSHIVHRLYSSHQIIFCNIYKVQMPANNETA